MADTETPPAPAAPETPPTPDEPTTPPAAPEGDGEEIVKDPAAVLRKMEQLRGELRTAKASAKDADALKARLDEIEAAKLSDQERAERERDEAGQRADRAEAKLRDESLKVAVLSSATDLGIASPRLALAALDRSAIEYDEDGAPQGVREALEALLEAEPVLRGTPAKPPPTGTSADAGAGQKAGPKPDLTTEELAMAERLGMSPEKYAALRDVETVDDWNALTKRDKAAAGG